MELICKASAKYAPLMNEICDPLFEMLKQHSVLEKEIFERDEQLEREKEKAGIPSYQTAPGWKELMKEYRERMYSLLKPNCTDKLLSRGYAGQYGNPQKFGYLNGDCVVEFKMRYADKASVETHYTKAGLAQKHKIVIRLTDGRWLVDELYYGFEKEKSWHSGGF